MHPKSIVLPKKLLLLLIYFPESARMMFLFLDNIRLVLYN